MIVVVHLNYTMHFYGKVAVIICAFVASLGLLAASANLRLITVLPTIKELDLLFIKPAPDKENDVPFTSQAPEGNWQEPWQNACEEASIVMIQNFYSEQGLTIAKAREQILAIFQLKQDTAPTSKDESMERIAEIINSGNLIWQAHVVDEPSLDVLKAELSDNHPIIAPVYGPLLNNPNYTNPGPLYHVIVITGYDDATGEFITHDPGTEQGENYRYPYEVLLTALHDYLVNKDYTAGAKRVLFTEPR